MRISLNALRRDGPYGGANQFANALEEHLAARGHDVQRKLAPNLDVVLIVTAQAKGLASYGLEDVARYARAFPRARIVQRVNTADEPRGEDLGINRSIIAANALAHHTVFVSRFVQNLFAGHGLRPASASVIHSGADERVFNPTGRAGYEGRGPLRIVTHHWSTNYRKGFDVYERLDRLLAQPAFRERFAFTFVGRVPLGVTFENTQVLPPLQGDVLAEELKGHHLYLTAARLEPAGNHYIEAMQCGLPVLYLDSGSLPEYCEGRGIAFDLADFEDALQQARQAWPKLHEAARACPFSATRTVDQYAALFADLVAAAPAAGRDALAARLLWKVAPPPGSLKAALRRAGRRALG